VSLEDTLGSRRLLNIGLVVRALPVQRLGGLEYHAHDLAVGLARRGHRVHIISTLGAGREQWPAISGQIQVHEMATAAPANYSLRFFYSIKSVLIGLCRECSLDIIIAVDLAGLFLNPRNIPVPVVSLIHGTMTSEVPLDWRYWRRLNLFQKAAMVWRYKTRILLQPVFCRMIRMSHHLIVDSEFTKRELLFGIQSRGDKFHYRENADVHRLNRRINVVPLGIDPERYPQVQSGMDYQPGEPLQIALLGRLQQIKGIAQTIYAAQILMARGVDFRMSIGGTGNFAEEAEDLIRKLNLLDKVRLVGRVEPADIGLFLCSHHVFLFPDLTQPAFGLVAVEAFRYGLPVIAAHVGAVPEVVTEECGWLYDPWRPDDLAAILADIATEPELLKGKAEAAKIRFRQFTVDEMAARTEDVLVRILG